MHRTVSEYTMQSVVDRTGVPADTIRSWERRHGFPAPARDAQNQRVYSEHDVQAILRLKTQTARGITVKEALRLLPDLSGRPPRPHSTAEPPNLTPASGGARPETVSSIVDRLLDVLVAFDGAAARTLLHTEMATQSPEAVVFGSLLPAFERLAPMNSAEAMFARGVLHRILVSLFNASDPECGRNRIVVARAAPATRSPDTLLALAHGLAASRLGFAVVHMDEGGDVTIVRQVISSLAPHAVILIADTMDDIETAGQWWSLLEELPSVREWTGRRFVASPRCPPSSWSSGSNRPAWLPPDASAARALLESPAAENREAIQIVSNQ